jgi:hypothetical protein
MFSRVLIGGIVSAAAGAAMLAISAAPASAFTLSAPSLEPQISGSNIEQAWWHHGWGWHGGWHRGWGWHGGWHHGWGWHGGWHGGWGWHRRCWVGRWGHVHCW